MAFCLGVVTLSEPFYMCAGLLIPSRLRGWELEVVGSSTVQNAKIIDELTFSFLLSLCEPTVTVFVLRRVLLCFKSS